MFRLDNEKEDFRVRNLLSRCLTCLARISVVFSLLTISQSQAGQSNDRIEFSGGVIVASGFRLREDPSKDSRVAMGVLKRDRDGLKIGYSIFTENFLFADPKRLRLYGNEVVWSRRAGKNRAERVATLVNAEGGHQKLYISFPNKGAANFIVESSGSVLSPGQVREAEQIVATFEPKRTELRRKRPLNSHSPDRLPLLRPPYDETGRRRVAVHMCRR